jgi:hypothetical protein
VAKKSALVSSKFFYHEKTTLPVRLLLMIVFHQISFFVPKPTISYLAFSDISEINLLKPIIVSEIRLKPNIKKVSICCKFVAT